MAAAITTLGRLGVDSANPVTQRFDFIDFELGVQVDLKDMNGTRGKYSKDSSRYRPNLIHVAPRLRCQPTSLELSRLLPWILGGTTSGAPTVTYNLGNTAPQRFVAFDPNGGNLWTLSGVVVDVSKLRANQGEPLDVDLSLVGQSYTVSGSFPAITLDVSTQPFLFVDAVITVAGTTVQSRDFELTISNGIDRSRFFNSPTLTATNKLTRKITCHVTVPYGDFSSLFGTGQTAAATLVATLTNGGAVLTITMNGIRFTPKSPQSPSQQEVMLPLEGEAFSPDGAAEALVITLNPGP